MIKMAQNRAKVTRTLMALLWTVFMVFGSFILIKLKSPVLYGLIPAIPMGVYLFAHPAKINVPLVLATYSRLKFRGSPGASGWSRLSRLRLLPAIWADCSARNECPLGGSSVS
jgi:hypothetical protein